MSAPPAPPLPAERPPATVAADPRWSAAETAIRERLGRLSRWESERWAAGHERRLSPLAAMAVRVAAMQAAIESGKDRYLEAAFDRLAAAAAGASWVNDHCGGRCVDPEHRQATREALDAVVELGQQALSAIVLGDEAVDGTLRADRARQLERAVRTVLGPPAEPEGAGPERA